MKKNLITLSILLASLGTFAGERSTANHNITPLVNSTFPVKSASQYQLAAMTVTMPLTCGLTITFQYTPAPGATFQETMMELNVIQGMANTYYCPPPPPLYMA